MIEKLLKWFSSPPNNHEEYNWERERMLQRIQADQVDMQWHVDQQRRRLLKTEQQLRDKRLSEH